MISIKFVEHNGKEHDVEGEIGQSVMRVALNNGIPDIIADCGGQCACATCHVYIEGVDHSFSIAESEEERDMLECAIDVQDNSRLSCQVTIIDKMDGMIVKLPESQL